MPKIVLWVTNGVNSLHCGTLHYKWILCMNRRNPKHSPAQTLVFSLKLLDTYFKQVVQPPGSILKSIDLTEGVGGLHYFWSNMLHSFVFSCWFISCSIPLNINAGVRKPNQGQRQHSCLEVGGLALQANGTSAVLGEVRLLTGTVNRFQEWRAGHSWSTWWILCQFPKIASSLLVFKVLLQ